MVNVLITTNIAGPVMIPRNLRAGPLAHRSPARPRIEQISQCSCASGRVVSREQNAGFAVREQLAVPADIGRGDEAPLRHGFERLQRRHQIGQALGFALIGISGVFCSLGGDTSTLQAEEGSALVTEELSSPFACPLCSASFFCLLFLFGVFWLLARANRRLINRELRAQAPPRYCWPSANPRASPF